MAEKPEWRRKFLSIPGLYKPKVPKRDRLRLSAFFLLAAAVVICGRLFTVPVLVKIFNVPPPDLPEPLTTSSVERAHQQKLPLASMGTAIVIAVVAAEDRRFYNHHGIDGLGAIRATIDNLKAGRMVEGGSTITQQLAKTVFLDFREKTANRKMQQLILAWELEDKYPKERILEAYLNEIYFGNGCYGIEAASRFYFGKDARQLDLAEAAFLAGLVQSPSRFGRFTHRLEAIERQKTILAQIKGEHLAEPAQVAQSVREKLNFTDK
jgi:membrane peptidoglycan carboxypeptidase